MTEIASETDITGSEKLNSEIPPEAETFENIEGRVAGEPMESDDAQSERAKEAEASPEEPISNSDQLSDTEDTDEFQDGLQTSVISSQDVGEKPKIIEPAQVKPDDANDSQ